MHRSIGIVLLVATATSCGTQDAKAPAAKQAEAFTVATVGEAAPSFTVATIGGDSARIGGTAKQPVTLVNVWATWCGPCKAEFPELQALHTAYGAKGLRLLAISIDTEADSVVTESARSMGATFAIGRDPDDQVRGKFAAVGIPESWLISADGKLLWRHSGAIVPGDPSVRSAIEAALIRAQ
jgi:thiol-disulfide isomerase/thioredoxin